MAAQVAISEVYPQKNYFALSKELALPGVERVEPLTVSFLSQPTP